MSRNNWATFPTILVALCLILLVPVPVPAEAAPTPQPDTELLARTEGISVASAMDTYGWQEQFNVLTTKLADEFSSVLGEARVTGPTSASISFVGRSPVDSGDLSIPGVSISVLENARYSGEQLSEALEQQYLAARSSSDMISESDGEYNVSEGIIDIHIELKSDASADAKSDVAKAKGEIVEAVAQAGIHAARQVGAVIPARVSFVDRALHVNAEADARGGAYLNLYSGGAECTWGFTVVVIGAPNARGVATAGHCATGQPSTRRRYYNHATSDYTVVSRQDYNTATDVAWYSTGSYTATPTMYYDYSSIRDIRSLANPSVGSSLANFGRTNGFHVSGTVYKKDFCASNFCHLSASSTSVTAAGDSGGPWFFNTTAYGTLTGTLVIDNANRDVFVPVTYLQSVLGVQVLTS